MQSNQSAQVAGVTKYTESLRAALTAVFTSSVAFEHLRQIANGNFASHGPRDVHAERLEVAIQRIAGGAVLTNQSAAERVLAIVTELKPLHSAAIAAYLAWRAEPNDGSSQALDAALTAYHAAHNPHSFALCDEIRYEIIVAACPPEH